MHLPPDLAYHLLYSGDGRHLGDLYRSIAIDGQLTPAREVNLAGRPYQRLFWNWRTCLDPQTNLGLVWFLPVQPNPLASGWDVVSYLVQVLDAGQSVQLHSAGVPELDQLCEVLERFMGGGHA